MNQSFTLHTFLASAVISYSYFKKVIPCNLMLLGVQISLLPLSPLCNHAEISLYSKSLFLKCFQLFFYWNYYDHIANVIRKKTWHSTSGLYDTCLYLGSVSWTLALFFRLLMCCPNTSTLSAQWNTAATSTLLLQNVSPLTSSSCRVTHFLPS
jgi:hypothetical protein